MKKLYFRSAYGYFYKLSIEKVPSSNDIFKPSIEEFAFVDGNEDRKLIIRICKVKKDGYYIFPRIKEYERTRTYAIAYAPNWLEGIEIILGICEEHLIHSQGVPDKYAVRLRNLRELPNYYMAMALLRFDFENGKKDLDY